MKAVITWSGGKTEIEDANLGDPRVAQELDRLVQLGVRAGVTGPINLEFQDDFV